MADAEQPSSSLHPVSVGLRALLAFGLMGPVTLLYLLVCVVLLPWRRGRILGGNLYGKMCGQLVFRLAGIRPVIDHPERITRQSAIFVCNHASTIDMWVAMWLCPFGGVGVAKREITRIPFFGQGYALSGHLLLDRGNRQKAMASMARIQHLVREHRLSLWMWPEGTRSRDGRLQPMKKGFVHLAIATGLPLVPVIFHDADLMWPSRGMRVTPGDLHICVLDPVDTSSWKPETAANHAAELSAVFQQALGPRQRARGEASTA